jgi:acyl-coenzyme A synthetase/AMP-(fatty) acid ligase
MRSQALPRMNIVDPILFNARYNPSAVAVCTPGTDPPLLTYGELEGWTNNIARLAVSHDMARGQIVAVYVADKILHLAIVLALARLGIPTISPRTPILPNTFDIPAVITDQNVPFENAKRVITVDAAWKRSHEQPLADHWFYQTSGSDLCRIAQTSGTTGEAKAIAFTHEKLLGRIGRYQFIHGGQFSACRRLFCDFGIQSGIGFQTILYMLCCGGTIHLFGADSQSMVQAFDLYKVDGMIAAPQGLSQYLQFYELPGAPECGFDFIVCLGAPLSRALTARVQMSMSPNLLNAYGSTECGQVAAGPVNLIAQVPGAVGFVAPDVVIEIVDDADNALPVGAEGRVRIKSPYSVTEYFGDRVGSTEAFRGEWFYPGDVGSLAANRMLFISGRSNSVINIGGDKIKPELVEEVLVRLGKIQEAAVFAHADSLGIAELWAAVVLFPHAALDVRALQSLCAISLGRPYAPRRIIQVASLPKNRVGKLDRSKLAALIPAP